jgi:DNA-binding protein H-NS
MAQSYAQMQEQIAKLQNEAKALRQSEVAGVVSKIKEAIARTN